MVPTSLRLRRKTPAAPPAAMAVRLAPSAAVKWFANSTKWFSAPPSASFRAPSRLSSATTWWKSPNVRTDSRTLPEARYSGFLTMEAGHGVNRHGRPLSFRRTPVIWNCLIIEDDRENAHYIAEGFRELGHWPVVCHDGVEGLHRASTETWDLIILDRMLPNQVDGLTILTKLRAVGIKTPVIVLSALTALDERVRGLKA